jgi:hypothetical protein
MDPRGHLRRSEDPVRLSQKFKPPQIGTPARESLAGMVSLLSHAGGLDRPLNPEGACNLGQVALGVSGQTREAQSTVFILWLKKRMRTERIVQPPRRLLTSSFTPGPMVELKETFFR